VGSRINCWTERNKEPNEKSPERTSTSKGKQPVLTTTVYVNNQPVLRPVGEPENLRKIGFTHTSNELI